MTPVSGILLLIILFLLCGGSLLAGLRGKNRLCLLLILVTGLGLRLFCAADPMLHPWDERYHALVAKNMTEQPLTPKLYREHVRDFDYRSWTANEIWLHKQPVPLWGMALGIKMWGVSEISARLPSVLLSVLSILLTFRIAVLLFHSERVGLVAAFLQAVNGLCIELASGRVATDHIDTFFLFFTELSLFLILLHAKNNRKILLVGAGAACGAAILTKWLPALIVFPLYLIINAKRKNPNRFLAELVIMGGAMLLVALPWQIYAYALYPAEYRWEQHFNRLHFTEGLDGHGRPWWYFIDRIRVTVNEMIYPVLLWFGYYAWKAHRMRRENLLLLVYLIVPFLVFSVAKTKMQGYLLFTFPAYFILLGLFTEKMWFVRDDEPPAKKFRSLKILASVLIFALALRYGLERVKPLADRSRERQAKQELLHADFPKQSVLFNIPCPIEVMFYTDCIAYPDLPDRNLTERLHLKNYNLFIVDDGNLSNELMTDERIEKVELPLTLGMCR